MQKYLKRSRPRSLPRTGGRYARGNKKGYAGIAIKTWEICSHISFLLGAACYMVNGTYWFYFDLKYDDFKMKTTASPAFNFSNFTNGTATNSTNATNPNPDEYYNYYKVHYEKFDNYARWWEVAGAVLYMMNPLLEFGTGALKKCCGNHCCSQITACETFISLPWMPLAAMLFLIGSLFYFLNVFIPLLSEDDDFDAKYATDAYSDVDLCAAITFMLCAGAYFTKRLTRKHTEIGTSDETSYLCCGPKYRGCLYVDWGFWGDILFLIGVFVELRNHFEFTAELNMVACTLWFGDACLYTVEWILVHKCYIGRPDPEDEERAEQAELNKGANKFTVDPENVCYSTFSLKDLDNLEDDNSTFSLKDSDNLKDEDEGL